MNQNTDTDMLSCDDLLHRFDRLVRHDRRTTVELLRTLEVIDRRKTWADEGYPSTFAFCVERYRMSEATANKRIRAARAGRRFPEIFTMIAAGEIHLTGVGQLAKHLTEDNCREVLERAKHKTMRDIDLLVAELAPEPERPSRLAALPGAAPAKAAAVDTKALPLPVGDHPSNGARAAAPCVDPLFNAHAQASVAHVSPVASAQPWAPRLAIVSGSPTAPRNAPPRAPDPRPIAPQRFRLSVTLSQEGHDRLRQLQALWAHRVPDGDPALLVEKALEALLDQSLKEKAAQTKRPRKTKERAPRAEEKKPTSRTIPAAVRRAVWARDEGCCAFVASTGHRCGTRHRLEFHHVKPWARGGAHEVDNIELRCRAHNQLHAERDYGRVFMDARRGKPRVEEGRARYEPVATVRVQPALKTFSVLVDQRCCRLPDDSPRACATPLRLSG